MRMRESIEKVTPIRVKVRRIDELARKKKVKTGKEGRGDNTTVVEPKLSLPEGRCSLGAKPVV